MSYKVVRNSQGDVVAFGPNDNNYEPHIAAGNVLTVENTEPTLAATIPQTISRYQAMVQLRRDNKIAALTVFLNGPGKEDAKDAFENLGKFSRNSNFITTFGAEAGFTEAELDQLFINASAIT